MKRSFGALAALLIAIVLTACQGILGGEEEPASTEAPAPLPTYTQLPTYTPLPTFTQPPQPTATATFLPSPTPIDDEEATEGGETSDAATSVPDTTTGGATTQAALAFGSNLREGPGTDYDVVTFAPAGEPLTIIGRDQIGAWLLVQTGLGTEGWVRITQFDGRIDIVQVPLAPNADEFDTTQVAEADPTATLDPDVTPTVTPTLDPDITPTVTPTLDPEATTDAPASSDPTVFALESDGSPVCNEITWASPGPFEVEDTAIQYEVYDAVNASSIVGQPAYLVGRDQVADFIEIYPDGTLTPNCNADGLCNTVTFTLCAFARPGAPTGGFLYEDPITLEVGTQSYADLFEIFTVQIPLEFTISE